MFLGDGAEVRVELIKFVLHGTALHVDLLLVDLAILSDSDLGPSLSDDPRAPEGCSAGHQVNDAATCEIMEAGVVEPALAPGPGQDDRVNESGKEEGYDHIG